MHTFSNTDEAIAGFFVGLLWTLANQTKFGRIATVAMVVFAICLRLWWLGPVPMDAVLGHLVADIATGYRWIVDHQYFSTAIPIGTAAHQLFKWVLKQFGWPRKEPPDEFGDGQHAV